MNEIMYEPIDLKRECEAIEIPSGDTPRVCPQARGCGFRNFSAAATPSAATMGYMFRIDAQRCRCAGVDRRRLPPTKARRRALSAEQMVWDAIEDDLRSGDSGQHRRSRIDLFLRDHAARAGRQENRCEDVDDGSGLRHGKRSESRCGNASWRDLPEVKEVQVELCSIRPGVPARCRKRRSCSWDSISTTARFRHWHLPLGPHSICKANGAP